MNFDSWAYVVFLTSSGILAALFLRLRPALLPWACLAASFLFYAFAGRWALGLFAAAIGVNYALSRWMQSQEGSLRKAILAGGILFNLAYLFAFKYAGLVHDSALGLAQHFGWVSQAPPPLQVLLPIGISFYTFESLSFLVDSYRGAYACPSLRDLALFLGFFPHLVAGPILRGKAFFPQIGALGQGKARPDYARARDLLILGFFKKLVLANPLSLYVDAVFARPGGYGGVAAWLAAYAFALQIYLDFSGYTDIAEGSAALFGIRLTPNFRSPYAASSPSDFWRRWHISLSSWLRDYLYIPLGGSRQGRARTIAAVLATMVLGGLWHGANWTFALWGLYHGLLLAAERFWGPEKATGQSAWARKLLTFHAILIGWVLFRSASVSACWDHLVAMGQGFYFRQEDLGMAVALLAVAALARWEGARNEAIWAGDPCPPMPSAFAAMAAFAVIFAAAQSGVAQPFLYFRF